MPRRGRTGKKKPCSRGQKYPNKATALEAAREEGEGNVLHCSSCGRWHVSRRKQ